jgi:colanic acid/amylovoran biosynthesis protein
MSLDLNSISPRPQKVLVGLMGASLGTGNRGVSALSASVIKLVTSSCSSAEVSLVIGHKTSEPFVLKSQLGAQAVRVENFRMSLRSGLRKHLIFLLLMAVLYRLSPFGSLRQKIGQWIPFLGYLRHADFVFDIRGGDSFSDIYGLRNFFIGSLPVFVVLLVRGQIGLLPQTYGPFNSVVARSIARCILRRASIILSRDSDSMRVVERLIGPTKRCKFCPDVAFSLETRPPDSLVIDPPLPAGTHFKLIGLNVNGLMYRGGYTRANMFGLKLDYGRFLKLFVEAILTDPNNHLLLVPHTFAGPESVESDPQACRELKAMLSGELQSRVHMLEGDYDQGEVKYVIGQCAFFVGSRMHACIAALSQGIPTIGVAYSKKFLGVFESVGVADLVIDGRDFDAETAVRRAIEIYANSDALGSQLAARVIDVRATHRAVFSQIFSSAGPDQPASVVAPAEESSARV